MGSKKEDGVIEARRKIAFAATEKFSNSILRAQMGWGDSPISMTAPTEGNHTVLFFVGPDAGPRVLLRVFEDAAERLQHRQALQIGHAFDLPIPRIIYPGGSFLEKMRRGYYFFATSMAPGSNVDQQPSTVESRRAVARATAKLNSVEREFAGLPGEKKSSRSFGKRMVMMVEHRLRVVEKFPADLGEKKVQKIKDWFSGQADYYDRLDRFQLCHMHLHCNDILYDAASDTCTIIDCVDLEYNRACRDLANFEDSEWMGGADNWQDFLETYLAESPESRRAELEVEAPYYKAYRCLVRLSKYAKQQKENVFYLKDEQVLPYVEKLLEITEN